jgi:hypothetical protein
VRRDTSSHEIRNADSVLELSDGVSIFVTPYEREVDFDEALRYISNTGLISDDDGMRIMSKL